MEKPKIIAFYLPQFHPFKENDEWWGKGFTEWTNVAKAKPLFRGHDQPKIPADLGFYDLRLPIIREEQARLAKEAGIEGFCYWHYWFGNGKRLMADIFDEVLETGKPDFPFCLAWANHSWYAKLWNKNDSSKDRLLIKQTYPGDDDIRMHFEFLLKAFKDERYIKYDGAPVFVIFNPSDLPQHYVEEFQRLAKENGFTNGIYLVANITMRIQKEEDLLKAGYDAVTYQRLTFKNIDSVAGRATRKLKSMVIRKILNRPIISDYKEAIDYLIVPETDVSETVIPVIIPNWDHTPRSGVKGSLFKNASPENFKLLAKIALSVVSKKNNKLIFLKSWNEWGEGNYMEPDLKFGKGFINALREAINESE